VRSDEDARRGVSGIFLRQGHRLRLRYLTPACRPTPARAQGVAALWRGALPDMFRVAPVYALKFSMNDFFVRIVTPPGASAPTFAGQLTAGARAPAESVANRLRNDFVTMRLRTCMKSCHSVVWYDWRVGLLGAARVVIRACP
jgi:hypothetical protein